jgi:BirA family transcriptional regulator, biotin operon repressor / biotin---[acetyl-CoA-carboxylase] ligase
MQLTFHHFGIVSSTMNVARDLAQQGAPEGTVVVADEQSAGRGRGDHRWYSPPEQSLYLSIVLRPILPTHHASWITMIAALAVRDVVAEIIPTASARIKWFNDVLLNGRKVCGILVESSITGDHFDYAVLGIGLNVNTTFDSALPDVQSRATSLRNEYKSIESSTTGPIERDEVLVRVLSSFSARYDDLLQHYGSPAKEYAGHLDTLGRVVHINSGSEVIEGRALRIAEYGALLVLTSQGERCVRFGEIN